MADRTWLFAAFHGIGGKRAGDERGFEIGFGREQIDECECSRNLGAVEKREAFLRFELELLDSGPALVRRVRA